MVHGRLIATIIRYGASELSKGICRFYWLHNNPNGYPDCLKTVLQGLPLYPSCLSIPALFLLVVANFEPPWRDLASEAITVGEVGRVLLQDSGSIFPVLLLKMIPEPVPSPRGPR